MTADDKINLLGLASEDWISGFLPDFSFCLIANAIINPPNMTEADKNWALDKIDEFYLKQGRCQTRLK